MKTTDIIIFSLCVGFFVIGVYETMTWGISYSYLWFMISIGLLLLYSYRRRQAKENEQGDGNKER